MRTKAYAKINLRLKVLGITENSYHLLQMINSKIKLHDKIIIIENKSNWADDQPNQLYRYWFYGIYLPQKNFADESECYKRILYLSPSDFKYPSDQTLKRPDDFEVTLPETVPIPIDVIFFNNEIVKWLSKCMDAVKEVPEIYYFIKQYLDYWRNK